MLHAQPFVDSVAAAAFSKALFFFAMVRTNPFSARISAARKPDNFGVTPATHVGWSFANIIRRCYVRINLIVCQQQPYSLNATILHAA